MATVTLNSLVLADGFDLSNYLKSVDIASSVDMLENTVLGQTSNARSYQPGLPEHSVSGEAFFAYDSVTDANSIDRTFDEALGASANKKFLIAPSGYTAIGNACFICNTKQANYSIKETVGDLIMLSFEAKATSAASATEGTFTPAIILGRVTATTTGALSSVDNATTSAGYLAQCHITEADTLTQVIVKVQHSTDDAIWADLATFTFSANGAQQAYATTTVNRYRRVNVTTFTGTSARVTVGFKSAYSI